MIKSSIFLALILFVYVSGKSELSSSTGLTDHLDERLPELMEYYDIPGVAVGLVQDGKPLWSAGFGYTDRLQAAPVTSQTYFRAESMTKSLTAWAVMRLVDKEKINLNDPVTDHLTRWKFPESEFDIGEITIGHLLSHRAGMRFSIFSGVDMGDFGLSSADILERLADKKTLLVQPPGEKFIYSNPGYVVLELLIEEVSGISYPEFVQQELFFPLGMNRSGFMQTTEIERYAVTGYLFDGQPVPLTPEPIHAHGGLYTTVDDFLKFVAENAAGNQNYAVLSRDAVHRMHTPEIATTGLYALGSDSSGLGHFTETLDGGQKLISHGGQGSGWLSYYYIIPETGDGLVIFTNSEQSWRLIADVLEMWTNWLELSSPVLSRSFSVIASGLWVIIAAIILAALVHFGRTGLLWSKGHIHFAPFKSTREILWYLKLTGATLPLLAAWWISANYLISGMFPVISIWLMRVLILLSFGLLLSVCCFQKKPIKGASPITG